MDTLDYVGIGIMAVMLLAITILNIKWHFDNKRFAQELLKSNREIINILQEVLGRELTEEGTKAL